MPSIKDIAYGIMLNKIASDPKRQADLDQLRKDAEEAKKHAIAAEKNYRKPISGSEKFGGITTKMILQFVLDKDSLTADELERISKFLKSKKK